MCDGNVLLFVFGEVFREVMGEVVEIDVVE